MPSNPENQVLASTYIQAGIERIQDSDPEGALVEFRRAANTDPDSYEAFSNIGSVHQLQGEHQLAVNSYQRALEIHPAHIQSRYCLAISMAALNRLKEALEAYNETISQEPDFYLAYTGRGWVWMQMGYYLYAHNDFVHFLNHEEEETDLIDQVNVWLEELQQLLDHGVNPSADAQSEEEELLSEAYRILTEEGNPKRALGLYNYILDAYPYQTEALANRANIYASEGNLRLALDDISQAITLSPYIEILYFNRGNIHYDLGNHSEAMSDYHKALEIDPGHAASLAARGKLYLESGNHALALDDLVMASEIDQGIPEVYEDIELIVNAFNQRVDDNPDDPYVYVNRAKVLLHIGRIHDALGDWNRAVRLKPDDPLLLNGRGNLLLETDNPVQALNDMNDAIELAPDRSHFYHDRANILIQLGEAEKAYEDLSLAIHMAPEKADYYMTRGILMRARGNYEPAIDDLNQTIELGNDLPEVYQELALAFLSLGKMEEASRCYMIACKNTGDPELFYDCASTLLHTGKIAEAIPYLNQAIAIYPDFAEAFIERGWAYLQLEETGKAIGDLNTAVKLQPYNYTPLLYRAAAFFRKEIWAEVINDASRVILWDSSLPEAYRLRGLAHYKMHNHPPALRDLKKYLSLLDEKPDDLQEVQAILDQISPSQRKNFWNW